MAKLYWLSCLVLAVATHSGMADDSPALVVRGRVYCDACAAGHFAKSSFYLTGAKVGVQCASSQLHGRVTAYVEGKTDANGEFSIAVSGEHEQDFCVALVLHSTHPTCNLLSERGAFATVLLTRNAGIADGIINTGPFSFKPGRAAHSCASELAEDDPVRT